KEDHKLAIKMAQLITKNQLRALNQDHTFNNKQRDENIDAHRSKRNGRNATSYTARFFSFSPLLFSLSLLPNPSQPTAYNQMCVCVAGECTKKPPSSLISS